MGDAHPSQSAGSLDEASLLEEARERTGLRDFGDEGFREPLRRLLASLEAEAALHAEGRATQRARLVESLATRLSTENQIRRHPEILEERIDEPVVIVGLARTGTTLLHRLLASGGDFQVAQWWECRFPAPFAGSDWRNAEPRIAAARQEVQWVLDSVPALASIHPWDAEGADEEIMLLEHSFLSHVPESGANVPGYRSWLDEQDLRPAYAYLRRLLRFLQWQKRESGRPTGRWLLKAPFHLGYLDVLFDSFPGARVVQTHRDPLETIPSAASMYRALWELNCESADPMEVGRQVEQRYSWALGRCLRAREELPGERFLDVSYRAVQDAPLDSARRIYEWLGVPLRAEAERLMDGYLRENAREKRRPHVYGLREFGLDAGELARRFAEYRGRFLDPGSASGEGEPALVETR